MDFWNALEEVHNEKAIENQCTLRAQLIRLIMTSDQSRGSFVKQVSKRKSKVAIGHYKIGTDDEKFSL